MQKKNVIPFGTCFGSFTLETAWAIDLFCYELEAGFPVLAGYGVFFFIFFLMWYFINFEVWIKRKNNLVLKLN